uniref:Uncharacterized protein n=1 Tax=Arundo donax TaxID=35708 RepID=A0A0A9H5W6_ARUDO
MNCECSCHLVKRKTNDSLAEKWWQLFQAVPKHGDRQVYR